MDEILKYLKEILALLVLIATLLGISIPQSTLDLLDSSAVTLTPTVRPTPTPEVFNDYGLFTPHVGYTINVRASCSRTAVRQAQITNRTPVEIDRTSIFMDSQEYTWARLLNGGCVVIAYDGITWGIVTGQ